MDCAPESLLILETVSAQSWFAKIGLTGKKLEHATAVCEDQMIECVGDLLCLHRNGELGACGFKPVVRAYICEALPAPALSAATAPAAGGPAVAQVNQGTRMILLSAAPHQGEHTVPRSL